MKLRINERRMIEPDPVMPDGGDGTNRTNRTNKPETDGWSWVAVWILGGVICLFGGGVVGRVLFEIVRLGWNSWG